MKATKDENMKIQLEQLLLDLCGLALPLPPVWQFKRRDRLVGARLRSSMKSMDRSILNQGADGEVLIHSVQVRSSGVGRVSAPARSCRPCHKEGIGE